MQAVRTPRRWGRAMIVALAGVIALGLAGCGGSGDAGSGAGVTIEHMHGETVVEGQPGKIVALGNQWLDAVQALGVKPAAYLDNVAVLAGGKTPEWEPASLAESQALKPGGDIAEQVAALEPDLILADPFIADAATYEKLSKVAPTLPGLTKAAVSPWEDQVTALGKVLDKGSEAEKVIADVHGKIDDIGAKNPGLKGKTFLSSWLAGPTQLMVLSDPNDGSSAPFTRLGMDIPQQVKDMPSSGGRVSLSPERVNALSSDFLLAGYSPGQDESFRQLPGFAELPAVTKNAVVFLDNTQIAAINQPTALSLPWILDKIRPALENAAK